MLTTLTLALGVGCGGGDGDDGGGSFGSGQEMSTADATADGGATTETETAADAGDGDGDGGGDGDGDGDSGGDGDGDGDGDDAPLAPLPCGANDLDAIEARGSIPACVDMTLGQAFEPVLEWAFDVPGLGTTTTPVVANLTDDNDDGNVDQCDTPDVVLMVNSSEGCRMYVLDGATGEAHYEHVFPDAQVVCAGTPALGDMDGDGVPEIVVLARDGGTANYGFVTVEADGTILVASEFAAQPHWLPNAFENGAMNLADVNADGVPEVIFNHIMWDADGALRWFESENDAFFWPTYLQSTMVLDLDGDADENMEIVTGTTAWKFDDDLNGTKIWDYMDGAVIPGTSIPQVGNFDGDADPEVLLTTSDGFFMLEHDGTPTWGAAPIKPSNLDGCEGTGSLGAWQMMRPAAVTDFDGDGVAEIAVSACDTFGVYDVDDSGLTAIFTAPIVDFSGASGSTAFDFLGDGLPEPVYSDEQFAYGWSSTDLGYEEVFKVPRISGTNMEYPIVVDVDNDGSAEILVVSAVDAPVLQVFRDTSDRWIQARRIWNQYSYTVTNVSETGQIPRVQIPSWLGFERYRVNAQLRGNWPCLPE